MSHDRVAELRGLSAEHQRLTQYSQDERAAQAAEQITRVRAEIDTDLERLDARAEELAAAGQDIPAGQVAAEARAVRTALAELVPEAAASEKAARGGAKSTAAAQQAPETA